MYNVNDIIVYANGGVCKIEDIGVPDFVKSDELYYKLQSISQLNRTIYLKVQNEKLLLRSVITEDEAQNLIDNIPKMKPLYSDNDKIRDKEYSQILKACECEQELCMMKGIYREQLNKSESGKKLGPNDSKNLDRVSSILASEFAISLNIPLKEAEKRIEDALKIR